VSALETWTCSRCGEPHSGIPGYSFDAPWAWYTTPESERSTSLLTEDHCILREEDYFIRGCLEIPVAGQNEAFIWGVWVSLSRDNFKREQSLRNSSKRVEEIPYFGWLSSRIQVYPDTLLLKTRVHSRNVGMAPYIELEPTEHPLAVEQRRGISTDRVREIAELIQHRWLHPEWDSKGLYGITN
jgi:hypothetical protein